ncbi:unnamed protein product [Allacma fusca]|uniref:Uncharacterized protein n=1 Tax=Allacma fusca TaxID=39272 RepID=A0A8J2PA53_9HEXA|nr:unnamed protein product [Allacma fusca]
MNKLFSKPFTSSVGSPMNLSQTLSQHNKFSGSMSLDTGTAFGEPDSTTSDGAGKEEKSTDHSSKEATVVAPGAGTTGSGALVSATFISPESPDQCCDRVK